MNFIIITFLLLGFLVVPLFTLAICKSAGMADRQLDQMRTSAVETKFYKVASGVSKKEPFDPSNEKTRPVFQRVPMSIE